MPTWPAGSEEDVAKAVAYGRRIKVYPLSLAANPPPTVFVDAIHTVFDSTIPYDLRFFQSLNRFVQTEPWLIRDKVMIDQLRSLGIEKASRSIPMRIDALNRTVPRVKRVRGSIIITETFFIRPILRKRHVGVADDPDVIEGLSTHFANPNSYPVDSRGRGSAMGFFSPKHLGAGQFCLMTITDKRATISTAAAPIA